MCSSCRTVASSKCYLPLPSFNDSYLPALPTWSVHIGRTKLTPKSRNLHVLQRTREFLKEKKEKKENQHILLCQCQQECDNSKFLCFLSSKVLLQLISPIQKLPHRVLPWSCSANFSISASAERTIIIPQDAIPKSIDGPAHFP